MSQFKRSIQWSIYSLFTGILAGLGTTAFLLSLDTITRYRISHSAILWGLPLAGLAIGWIYHLYGKDVDRGTNLVIDEIHDPKNVIPMRMAPIIFLSTIITHLFGGSAGREGAAVQVSASLSDQLSRVFSISNEERRILLVSGAGAGFSAAIGAPFAGIFFGMELIRIGRIRPFAIFECAVASFSAFGIARLFYAPHSQFPRYEGSAFDVKFLLIVAVASLFFALLSRGFISVTHSLEQVQHRLFRYPPLKPFFAGCVLVALYQLFSLENYAGLGIETIQEAFQHPMSAAVPVLKLILTAITISAGFKGGEFIPLVFIGSTAGSALSGLSTWNADPSLTQVLASVGFAAVFGAASNTPFSCTVMAIELFGWRVAPYAMLGCGLSYLASGNLSIYRSQVRGEKKLNFTFISK